MINCPFAGTPFNPEMKILPLFLVLGLLSCGTAGVNNTSNQSFSPKDASGSNELTRAAAAQGIYPELSPTRVTFVDNTTGLKIGLLNAASVEKADYYSEQRRNADYKIIPNLDMGALLKQFEELDFFTTANRSSRRIRGARKTIQVQKGTQFYTLGYVSGGTKKQYDQLFNCSLAVQSVYNVHDSYQRVDNKSGTEFFKEGTQDIFQK